MHVRYKAVLAKETICSGDHCSATGITQDWEGPQEWVSARVDKLSCAGGQPGARS